MQHSTRMPNPSPARYAAAASITALLFAAAMPFDSSADSALCITQPPALAGSERGATRRPRPLRGEWHAEIRVVGGIS
jgi:hypothetical protein